MRIYVTAPYISCWMPHTLLSQTPEWNHRVTMNMQLYILLFILTFGSTFQHKACFAHIIVFFWLINVFWETKRFSLIACGQRQRFFDSRGAWGLKKKFPNLPNLIWVMRLNVVCAPAGSLPLSRVLPVNTSRRGGVGCIPLAVSVQEVWSYIWPLLLHPTHAWFPWSVWWHLFPRDLCIHASWVIFICHVGTPRLCTWFPGMRLALWKWATRWENRQTHKTAFQWGHES